MKTTEEPRDNTAQRMIITILSIVHFVVKYIRQYSEIEDHEVLTITDVL